MEEYFNPLDMQVTEYPADALANRIRSYSRNGNFPYAGKHTIVLIGIEEDRGTLTNQGCCTAPDEIRKFLYSLKMHQGAADIIDLGNLIPGETLEDTYAAIADICAELFSLKAVPVLLGGSQDLSYAQYGGYKKLEQIINIVSVDSRFDLGNPEDVIHAESWLGKIILEQPNFLFNYSNIGYQTYFVGQENVELMRRLYFDTYRVGMMRSDLTDAEPVVRTADMISFDISSVRHSDAPGNGNASPNGFAGEEACQIMFYAGMNDRLSSLGLYEINPELDESGVTAHLAAQMLWYFIEGYSQRRMELPLANPNNYITYRVAVRDLQNEIVFLKSVKSDRWWMKLPMDPAMNRYAHQHLMPCSYKDYQQACNNEVPDRWWNSLQKLV
jgi:formiminoglutamase